MKYKPSKFIYVLHILMILSFISCQDKTNPVSTMSEAENNKKETLTIVLPGGKLVPEVLQKVCELRAEFVFDIYLSTAQNLRLFNIDGDDLNSIKGALSELGVVFKRPGLFPYPKVCIGKESCNLGLIDSDILSDKIIDHFGNMEKPLHAPNIYERPKALNCYNLPYHDLPDFELPQRWLFRLFLFILL